VAAYGPTLEENVWYHITGVFKGGQYVKLIVNGVEYSVTTNIPASIAASTNYDLHIGNGSYCSYPWDGIIDEVKIFNRALAPEEITDEAYKLVHLDFENITSNTVIDLSRHGNTGSLVNNPILTRTRVIGDNAIQLQKSNNKYVNCGRNSSLNGADELTIDTWVKADTLQSTGIDWILGKGTLTSPQSGYTLRCYHKQLQFAVYGSTGVAAYGPTLEENVWYHIIGVFKGGQYVKLIVNGVEYSVTTNIPASIAASPNYDLQIGNGSYCSYPWDGIIDEVKIYNKALY
ncbi:MAG: LamG domain-containing protein, partial [Lentisphaerota bacterium]